MLSYQHVYHAGNFADVHKHAILCLLLEALAKKEKPYFVLDAFAGRGLYPLNSELANKTAEYQDGITRVWTAQHRPKAVKKYLNSVRHFNLNGELKVYPGSPAIIQQLLRPQDRVALCELHPAEFEALRQAIPSSRHVKLYKRDAFEAIKAFLPPKERRGLLLLDPSYESKGEYLTIAETVIESYKHWREGTYAIWYPILAANNHLKLRAKLKHSGIRKILDCSLQLQSSADGMSGTGMLIINPPWHLNEQLNELQPWLMQHLNTEAGAKHEIRWLVPE